ncbi:MAG: spondin domain-containing protein [Myxococcota bacterium]
MTARNMLFLGLGCVVAACGTDDDPGGGGGDETSTTFTVRLQNRGPTPTLAGSGAFAVPDGASGPGPIGPGGAYEFDFPAAPGHRLSFATMFVPSNDLFYGPDGEGIALFDAGGQPVTGDVTGQVELWDAGTEIDQEIGVGADQVMRQMGPDSGDADPDSTVRLVTDRPNLPALTDVLRVTLAAVDEGGYFRFTARIENVSTPTTLQTSDPGELAQQAVPLSPGVYAVHTGSDPLFTEGEADRGLGLEAIAEDGTPTDLAAALDAETGVTILGSPGVFAVANPGDDLFSVGAPDRGQGLEAIAEDGSPGELAGALQGVLPQSGLFNTPVDAGSPGPLPPGQAYEFSVTAEVGQRLHVITMVVPSNDWIISLPADGIDLFEADGSPVSGDQGSALVVYDLGTEVDMPIGFGLDQVQFQAGPDTGAADPNDTIRGVGEFADPSNLFELIVTPQ